MSPGRCRLCSGDHLRCLGKLPDSDYFAGRALVKPMLGGELWLCEDCQSMFRHPVLTPSTYLGLYAAGAAEEWSGVAERQDLATIRSLILRQPRCDCVLDVGCGTGEFLLSLPKDIRKFGVEPSIGAAKLAEGNGVHIVGAVLTDIPADRRFDVITMIDVIEHVAEPATLLDAALVRLNSRGALIVATGDPANTMWRHIFRSRFWYSSFPEHITFPSARYFNLWRDGKALESPLVVQLKYRSMPAWRRALHLASQTTFFASPTLYSAMGRTVHTVMRAPRPRRRLFSPGAPGVFTDHQIVALRRRTPG